MSDFFRELAKQLAQRWLSLLAIPGVLFLAASWIGLRLGHAHALDARRLADAVNDAGAQIAHRSGATQALIVTGGLLASAVVGLVVQALVGPLQALCLGQWPRGLRSIGTALTDRRRRRWRDLVGERDQAERRHPPHSRTADQQRRIDLLAGSINEIAMAEPGRPTWMGDRVHALSEITINRYGLDLTFGWSRLWLVLPETDRDEINIAQGGFATALFTVTWSLPYLAVGVLWWPAACIGVVIAAVGWSRARAMISALTELTEAALDVHGRSLAAALGVADPAATGPLTPEEGQQITDIIRKGR